MKPDWFLDSKKSAMKQRFILFRRAGVYYSEDIRRYKAFQKAALDGVLVREVADPHAADAWEDYVQVVREVLP